jgi:hypothetical protein
MISKIAFERDSGIRSITICLPNKANLIYHLHYIWTKWSHVRNESSVLATTFNTDGIFNRFVTVFANRARHVSGELSLGRET